MSEESKPYRIGEVREEGDKLIIDVYMKVVNPIPYFEMSLTAEDLKVSEEDFREIAEDLKLEVDRINKEMEKEDEN